MTSLDGGGAEKVLMTMLHHFDYERFDVTLCVVSKHGVYVNELPSSLRTIFVYENPMSLFARLGFVLYSKLGISALERWAIRRKIREHYDTIVSFCEGRSLKFHGYVTERASRNITWVHCDLYTMHYTTGPVLSAKDEKRLYERMDEVVFVSYEACSQFEKFNFRLKHTSVVYNPIELETVGKYKREGGISSEKFRVVLCGRLTKQKSFDRIIRVASLLKQSGYDFIIEILGEGEDRQVLKELISQLSLEDNVFLRGFVKPPYPYMADCDLFVSTSIMEGYPINICEAMCLGLPIVATRCCGNTELVGEDEKFGILTEQDDRSIYEGIVKMITSPELRARCGRNAFEKSRSFAVEEVMKEVYSVL